MALQSSSTSTEGFKQTGLEPDSREIMGEIQIQEGADDKGVDPADVQGCQTGTVTKAL